MFQRFRQESCVHFVGWAWLRDGVKTVKGPSVLKQKVGEHGTPEAAVQALMAKVQLGDLLGERFLLKEIAE